MLTIKNLDASKDLDRAEMGAIKGGFDFFSNAGKNVNLQNGVSFASPQVNVAPVTQIDASTHTDVDVKNVTKSVNSLGSLITGLHV